MPEDAPRVDLAGCILTPAFAIAHTHLYMSLTCGMPPPPAPPRPNDPDAPRVSSPVK